MAYHLIKQAPSQQPQRICDPFIRLKEARAALLEAVCFGSNADARFWLEDDAGNTMTADRLAT